MSSSVLIVEDEIKIAEILRDYLKKSGYSVFCLVNGKEALSFIENKKPDIVLLDVMLPDSDGMEICRDIRKISNVPVIMITARADEEDRLLGLDLGADDYICKPFSPREVVARVKSVLKRTQTEVPSDQIVIGQVILDKNTRQVRIREDILDLTRSEYGLLLVLMTHPNRVFSRNELLSQVQGYESEGYERTVDSHIKNLRKKLESKLPGKEIITAVYGMGYKMNE